MRKWLILILFFGIIGICSGYTPPSYDSANLTLETPYTPPSYSSVNLTLGEVPEGNVTISRIVIQTGTTLGGKSLIKVGSDI